jgi:tetratricopeptide (TPR) repeat protein
VLWGSWEFRRLWVRASFALLGLALLAGFCFGIGPVQTYIKVTLSGDSKDKVISLRDVSLGGRTMMWESTVEMIRDHPVFGTGGMSWGWFHLKYRKPGLRFRPMFAHNDLLHYTSDYGLVGTGLLGMIIGCFFWQARLLARESATADQRSFAVGAAVATTAILVHSIFDFNMHILANALLLSAIFGFTAAAEDPQQRFKRIELGRLPRYALATGLLGICALAVWVVAPTCLAAHYTFLGEGAQDYLHSNEALRYYRKAIALDPKSWEPYAQIADIYRSKAEWRIRTHADEAKQLAHEAVINYEKALTLNPLNSEIMVHEARAYELIQQNEQVLKTFQRSFEVDPNSALAFLYLGKFYRNIGEREKAIEAFKRSKELNWFSDNVAQINLDDLAAPP